MSDLSNSSPFENSPRRRRMREGGGWMLGIMLMLIGGLLLANNLNFAAVENWWALFILLPSIGFFSAAWRVTVDTGRFNRIARTSFIGGLMLVTVAGMFFFSVNWTYVGPVMLMMAGLAVLVNTLLPD